MNTRSQNFAVSTHKFPERAFAVHETPLLDELYASEQPYGPDTQILTEDEFKEHARGELPDVVTMYNVAEDAQEAKRQGEQHHRMMVAWGKLKGPPAVKRTKTKRRWAPTKVRKAKAKKKWVPRAKYLAQKRKKKYGKRK